MPARNAEVATLLGEIAGLLEIEGDNLYRVRAYRNAAHSVAVLGPSIHGLVAEGAPLHELPDIDPELAMRIAEIVRTGSCPLLERLHRELPEAITELLKVPGIGPKRVHQLYSKLGIRSLEDLHRAAEQGRVRCPDRAACAGGDLGPSCASQAIASAGGPARRRVADRLPVGDAGDRACVGGRQPAARP